MRHAQPSAACHRYPAAPRRTNQRPDQYPDRHIRTDEHADFHPHTYRHRHTTALAHARRPAYQDARPIPYDHPCTPR